MKRLFFLIALITIGMLFGAAQVGAAMSSYCSVPPSVARAIAPNILIVMDTSTTELFSAYMTNLGAAGPTGAAILDDKDEDADNNITEVISFHDPTLEMKYNGYFKMGACYKDNGGTFEEVLNVSVSYTTATSCPNTAPFRGGMMNWATMSRYDVLQMALIGGKSLSPQGNAHTLVSEANNWVSSGNAASNNHPMVYGGCVFARGDKDNLEIRDQKDAPGSCSLLNTPPSAIVSATPTLTPTSTLAPAPAAPRKASFTVKVKLLEENFTDDNDNDIWDPGEPFNLSDDLNGNGVWDGKQGVIQKFSDADHPKARWGVLSLDTTGNKIAFKISPPSCIPAGIPQPSSFYTEIQNSKADDKGGVIQGVSAGIHYYGSGGGTPGSKIVNPPSLPGGETYTGCSGNDPIEINIPCRKNFMLVLTSGNFGGATDGNNKSVVFDASQYGAACSRSPLFGGDVVNLACFGKMHDLRSDLSGTQNVTTFFVYTRALGVASANEATLKAAALVGGSKKMYGGGEPGDLAGAIENAISDIMAQAASGTAVSVLTTSSRNVSSLLQAYFFPARQYGTQTVSWTGYLQNLWVDPRGDMREDHRDAVGGHDFKLKLEEDQITKLYFDPVAKEANVGLFSTLADGTGGSLAACTPTGTTKFESLPSLMEAGEKLALTPPSNRKIFTSTKVRHGTAFATTTCATLNCFNASDITGTLETFLDVDATYTKDKIIAYVRGECLESGVSGDTSCNSSGLDPLFRDRRVPVGGVQRVWKLGDMINSTPKQVGNTPQNAYINEYGDKTYYDYVTSAAYKDRSAIAVVGANDGMLHAFRVGYLQDRNLTGMKAFFENFKETGATDKIGEEVWAYIPVNAFPYLKYLANPDYCHIYYNDLPVRVVDASIGGTSTATKDVNSWRTILIGGMRYGGACAGGSPLPPIAGVGFSSYYAIDVTDPENPKHLWEFSDPDMGYAATTPAVMRTGASGINGHWYVALGSGSTQLPDSLTDIGRTTPGYVYILDMETGERVQKIILPDNAIVGGLLPVDIERDYRSEKLYFGTSYKAAAAGAVWQGKLMSLSIPDGDLSVAAGFVLSSLFAGNHPISAAPEAARYDTQEVWVYAGSGKYNSEVDETDLSERIFIGMKDPPASSSLPLPIGAMNDRTTTKVEGDVKSTKKACVYDAAATPAFAQKDIVTEVTQTSPYIPPSDDGWYITLTGGRRVITRPVSVGGLVDFLTYTPSPNLCDFGGSSNAYAVLYDKGVAPAAVALRTPGITSGNTGTVTVYNNVDLGAGAPPAGEGIILLAPQEGDDVYKQKIQLGTTAIVEGEVKPDISLFTTVMHWLKR